MMTNERPFCQVAGCHHHAVRCVDLDLPMAWEATRDYTTISVVAGLCREHGHDVSGRVQAMLEARVEFHDLLSIIEQAVRFEKSLELRLDAATPSMGSVAAIGPCCVCGLDFEFNAERVPSVPIDPSRAVEQPICAGCVAKINVARRQRGMPEIQILPGAYEVDAGGAA